MAKVSTMLLMIIIISIIINNVTSSLLKNRLLNKNTYEKVAKEVKKHVKVVKHKNLKPNVYSDNYNSDTIAIEIDENCLNDQNTTIDEMLNLINIEYPCLLEKENPIPLRHVGKIYRKYFKYDHNENIDDLCLENKTIEWDDYCILDISYEMILELHSLCTSQLTNAIYYGSTKKSDAWNLDLLDGKIDNYYKKPTVNTSTNIDDHKIDIWILDSGVFNKHNEFSSGQVITEVTNKPISGTHGTIAASIAGGKNYGSSKNFYIHDYLVCGNSVSGCAFSDVENGLLKIIDHMNKTGRRSVINLSLGSSGANSYVATENYYDSLFQQVIDAGGIIVTSAGNSGQDACNWWFSYSHKVISVGAHDSNKNKPSWSNYGTCVDIYAPGSYVPAANSYTDPTVVGIVSGTSFSSPMMVGIVVNLLYEDRTRTFSQILSLIQNSANRYPIGACTTGYCYGYYYHCT